MQRLLLALALVLSATAANAQKVEEAAGSRNPFSSIGAFPSVMAPWANNFGGSQLILDDGSAEDAIGLTAGGQFVWFNRFTPPVADFPMFLQSADVLFTSAGGFPLGSVYDVFVYSDPDGNPANGAVYVGGAPGQTVTALDAFITTSFTTPLTIATPGDVLIMVVNRTNTDAGIFPAAQDQDASQGRSWVGLYGGTNPGTPPVLPAPTQDVIDALGLPGNWLIRGTYTTEPIVGPNLAISPGTVAFGDVPTGETSTARTVTMTNNGTETVTISSVTLAGAAFAIDLTGLDTSLEPLESTTFTVTFTPPADGPATGTITVVSNDPDSPQTINLTGNGFSPPANDDREDAIEITAEGTYTGTNVAATVEPGEEQPQCSIDLGGTGGMSVWWVYTPAENGLLTVDLLASDYDTSLALYQEDGTLIDCNEDFPGASNFQSRLVNVPVSAGQAVYIRVGGWRDGDQGNISLDLSFEGGELVTTAIPAGDTTGEPTWARPTNVGSGTSGSCTINSGSGTAVAYEALPFNVPNAGVYTITTDYTGSADYDGYILLYQGTFNPADQCLNLIALDDDFNGLGGSQIEAVDLASGNYVLVVTGYSNEDFGSYTGDVVGPGAVNFNPVAGENTPDNAQTMLTASPNPVNSAARVRLAVATAQDVTVAVFDVTGRQVATLFQGAVAAGQAVDLTLDASKLPSGLYVVRASGDTVNLTQRVTVVR